MRALSAAEERHIAGAQRRVEAIVAPKRNQFAGELVSHAMNDRKKARLGAGFRRA